MATQGVQMNFWCVQNATFDENPYENERIGFDDYTDLVWWK